MNNTSTPKKWYDKTWLVILLCIFFFPVGLYALWKSNVISKGWKIGGTAVIALFVIAALSDDDKTQQNKNTVKASSAETQNEKKKETTSTPTKLTDEEYLKLYSSQFSNIKLGKRFGIAPLYGDYADSLNNILLDMESKDSLFHIFSNKSIKTLYDKNIKTQQQAVTNYLKYGNPDNDFFAFVNEDCKSALGQVLNDPDYDIVKDKYYLKQTAKGYDYKLLIRAKNGFGAKILSEETFSLQYNPVTKYYEVTSVR